MRITRLHLTDVRRHADFELRPSPGLTVVRGPNEAGKSTIEQAIELALYGETDLRPSELRRWDGPADAEPTVEMEFEDGTVAGRLVRRFEPAGMSVELVVDGERLTDPAAVRARLDGFTGMPTLAFFRSTAAVRQGELADLARDDATLRDRLVTSMSAADSGLALGMRMLENAIGAIDSEDASLPGPLQTASEEVARLRADVERGEAELARLAADQAAVSAARTTLAEVEAKLEIDREQLIAADEAVRRLAGLREAEAELDRWTRAETLRAEIEPKERELAAAPSPEALRDGVRRLRDLEAETGSYQERLTEDVDLSSIDVLAPEPSWRPFALLAIALAVAGVGAVAITGIAALGLLAALGLVSALVAIRQRRRIADVRRENQLHRLQIERRLRGKSVVEAQLQDIGQRRAAKLAEFAVGDVAAAEQRLQETEQLSTTVEQQRTELAGLLGDPPPSEPLAVLRDRAAVLVAEGRRAVAELGDVGADPDTARTERAAAVQSGQQARDRTRAAAIAAEARVEGTQVDAEEVAASVEALAAARERYEALERRRHMLDGTLSALRAAERATVRRAARFLEEHMAQDLERITDGRYRRVQVDEDTLAFRAWSPEREDWVDVRALSRGTLDQMYMAARLGLVRQLTEHRFPPLILDDPFITFDDQRAVRALEVLRDLRADHQILYLTHSNRYDEVADAIVVLAGPEGGDRGDADRSGEADRSGDADADRSGDAADRGDASPPRDDGAVTSASDDGPVPEVASGTSDSAGGAEAT